MESCYISLLYNIPSVVNFMLKSLKSIAETTQSGNGSDSNRNDNRLPGGGGQGGRVDLSSVGVQESTPVKKQ